MIYPFDEQEPLDGILFHESDKFDVTSTGDHQDESRVKNLWDKNSESYSCLTGISFPYFLFDFRDNQVKINKYSIQSYSPPAISRQYCKTWVLSGFDGHRWMNISIVLESKLDQPSMVGSFDVEFFGPFSKLKITQIGEPYYENTNGPLFCIGDIEFFGAFGKFNKVQCSCSLTHIIKFVMLFVHIILTE